MTEREPLVTTTHKAARDDREQEHDRRAIERPWRLMRLGQAVGAVTLTAAAILHTDIAYNKHHLSDTEPRIHAIASAIDEQYQRETTVYIDGFAGYDGSWITGVMTPAIQAAHDTNTAALEYDPDGISVPEIAKQIALVAERDQLESVSLHGYSIGGTIALEVAALLSDTYDVRVHRIFLDQSPTGADTIKQSVRDPATTVFVDIMGGAKALGFDMEYSSIARAVFDLVSPNDMAHLQDSTTTLMRDQFMYGIHADVEASLKKLAKLPPHDRPTLIYVSSTRPEDDPMVALAAAEVRYRELATTYGFDFTVIDIEGAIHSRPDLTLDAYEQAYADAHDTIAAYDPVVLSRFPMVRLYGHP